MFMRRSTQKWICVALVALVVLVAAIRSPRTGRRAVTLAALATGGPRVPGIIVQPLPAPQLDVPLVPAVPSMGIAAVVASVPTAVPVAGAAALDSWQQVAVDVLNPTSSPRIAIAQGGRDTTFNDYMTYAYTA